MTADLAPWRIGTRKSPLAQAQTDRVLSLLEPGVAEKVLVESQGDVDTTSPIHRMERPGAFTSVLTDAILDGRIDAAVHSLKDLPLRAPTEAPLVAILPRDDAADVLLAREESRDDARPLGLRSGSRVGTSAPRRQTQLLDSDAELVPVDVRGNVGTRLRLLEHGVIDALLMAAAAFERMSLPLPKGVEKIRLDPERWPCCPGQGTIAIQARRGSEAARALAKLDHEPTRRAVEAERLLLSKLGGGCGLPLGAHARLVGHTWQVDATLAPEGWAREARPRVARAHATAHEPAEAVARAFELLQEPPAPPAATARGRLLLLTLPPSSLEAYIPTLAEAGWRAQSWTLIDTVPTEAPEPEGADAAAWVAVTSPRAAAFAALHMARRLPPLPRLAALGPATARALRAQGLPVHLVSPDGTGASLAEALAAFPSPPTRVLLPQAEDALPDLADGLAQHGFEPLPWPVYRTQRLEPAPALPSDAEALVLTSPSNAEAYAAAEFPLHACPLVAFGPSTETAMRRLGLPVHAVATQRNARGILDVLP